MAKGILPKQHRQRAMYKVGCVCVCVCVCVCSLENIGCAMHKVCRVQVVWSTDCALHTVRGVTYAVFEAMFKVQFVHYAQQRLVGRVLSISSAVQCGECKVQRLCILQCLHCTVCQGHILPSGAMCTMAPCGGVCTMQSGPCEVYIMYGVQWVECVMCCVQCSLHHDFVSQYLDLMRGRLSAEIMRYFPQPILW